MNICLVHGAWCDASSWSGVIERLQGEGHEVLAVQLPLTGLGDDVAATQKAIASFDGPVGLVGHSYGGVVISAASSENDQVAGLIFVAAYAPEEGETVLSLGERFPASPGGAAIRPDDEGYLLLDRASFPAVFAADVDPVQARVLAAVQKPTHGSCFGTPLAVAPGWRTKPTLYLRSAADQMIHPEGQAWMAERIGAETITLESSHAAPVAHPAAVARAISEAVRAPTA